jgi:two-component system, NarL family, invasion response regulator UvrY
VTHFHQIHNIGLQLGQDVGMGYTSDKASHSFLLVDDHPLILNALTRMLMTEYPDARFDEANTCAQTLKLADEFIYDLIFLDLGLPDTRGFECLTRLKQLRPDVPVLVFSMHDEANYAARAVRAGAAGYMEKQCGRIELLRAVNSIFANGYYASETLALCHMQKSVNGIETVPHERLSDREFEVLCLIGQGKSVGNIAQLLSRSVKTISTHRANILEKMNMNTNAELVYYCIKTGLIT